MRNRNGAARSQGHSVFLPPLQRGGGSKTLNNRMALGPPRGPRLLLSDSGDPVYRNGEGILTAQGRVSMTTLLVTGGCGFIGSNFIRRLIASDPGVHVINFDALTYAGNPANLADLESHPNYRFVHGDITDAAAVRHAFSFDVRHVIHFAAESHVDRSIHDSGPFIRTNVLGTQTLLDAARAFQVER